MILVLFCLTVLIFFLIILMLLLLSNIRIKIQNVIIENFKLKENYKIYFQIYVFNKFMIFSKKVNLNKNKFKDENKSLNNKKKKENIIKVIKNNITFDKETIDLLSKLNPKIKYLNLDANLGIKDACIISYLVGIINGLVGIILPYFIDKNSFINVKIKPLYNKNYIDINLNCIISMKTVHIIYVICKLKKKGRIENERTSNRRPNAYSYEQY